MKSFDKPRGQPSIQLLKPNPTSQVMASGDRARPSDTGDWSLRAMFEILRRQSVIIFVTILIFALSGVAYLYLATPEFTATARMIIDTKRARFFPETQEHNSTIDASAIDSQIEIIKSEVIAAAVVKKLKLTEDPEFATPREGSFEALFKQIGTIALYVSPGLSRSLLSILDRAFGPSGKRLTSEGRTLHIAITNFERALQVNRVGQSYIAEINFTSTSPHKSAAIANAIADAYIDNELDARIYNTQRADAWIRRRLVELRHNYETASNELDNYKSAALKLGNISKEQREARLAELQSTADSYKSIYETFMNLSRYVQSVQEQSFPITEARIITKAAPPLSKSRPKTALTLLASLMLGAVAGTALAFGRGLRDRRIRTPLQVELGLGVQCLGVIPTVTQWRPVRSQAAKALRQLGIAALIDDCKSSAGAGEALRTMRSIIEARMPGQGCRVIGVTSGLRGEGKTTLAANLATIMQEADRRVLLVDGDLREHAITNSIAPEPAEKTSASPAEKGLYSAANGKVKLADAVVVGPFGWCLPVEQSLEKHPADFWSSSAAENLIALARKQYDYIIVDLPPLLAHADAGAAAGIMDAILIVTKYGSTHLDDLGRALATFVNIDDRLLGMIINQSLRT
jgi:polysaccharide biosynthesis transport protein